MSLSRAPLLALVALVAACSASTPPASSGPSTVAPTRQSDVITRAEIDAATGLTSALDAVQRLRPRFTRNSGARGLRAADSGPLVRLDNEMIGGIEALGTTLSEIGEIRYYSAVDATARFGGIAGRPVIHVTRQTRRQAVSGLG